MGRYLQRYPTTTKVASHEALGENLAASPATSLQETLMASNPEQTGHQRQHDCQNLMASVTGPEAGSHTASEVELTLFRRLLALGAARLRRCFVTRAALRPAAPLTAQDGRRLTSHDQRPTTDSAVFGNVPLWRHDCTGPGQTGLGPLDAALRVPARGYADVLREWAA